MSNQLVRVFTCASIISLGGLTAALGVVACSSDPAVTPAGDDDDTKGDDDDSTKTDGGSTSSSSSGGGKEAGVTRPASCQPAGSYTLGKPSSKVTTAGKVCDNYAKANNDTAGPIGDITITKEDEENYTMKIAANAAYVLKLQIAKDRCQLAGAEPAYGQKTLDADGNEINVAIGQNHIIDFDESNGVKDTVSIFVASDPDGAPGTPCVIQSTSSGTKK